MELDTYSQFKELSEEGELEIIKILNQYDSKKIFYSLVATTWMSRPDVEPSKHMEEHPICLLEILEYLILTKNFSGSEKFIYPEVLDNLYESLKKYSYRFPLNLNDSFSSGIELKNLFIRGSASCWQTERKILDLYSKYNNIIKEKFNINLDEIIFFIKNYPDICLKKIKNKRESSDEYSNYFNSIISNIIEKNGEFIYLKKDGSKRILKNEDEVSSYLRKIYIINLYYKELLISEENCQEFSLSIDTFKAISLLIGTPKNKSINFDDIRYYPLFNLDKESILITQNSTYDAILYHIDNLIKKECGDKFKKYKSEYTEKETFNSLCRIFNENDVYQNLSYLDPTKDDGKSTTELDIAVKYGRFLILCEVKSKQLRKESLRGDRNKLCSDLKVNIEDSFKQASRAIEYIESVDIARFNEIKKKKSFIRN